MMKKCRKKKENFLRNVQLLANKKTSGITLIALVITIIVLLILAGVSIATLTGDNGLLTKATSAKQQTEMASAKEQIMLAVTGSYTKAGNFDTELFKEEIEREGGTIVSEDEDTIVVELNGYEAIIDAKTGELLDFSKAGAKPEVSVEQTLSDTTVTITVKVTNEVESVDSIVVTNINKGTTVEGNVSGKTGTFETQLNGSYEIKVTATIEGIQATTTKRIEVNQIPVDFSMAHGRVEVIWLDKNNKVIDQPSTPNLGNMTKVTWTYNEEGTTDEDGNTINWTEDSTAKTTWYNYTAGTGTADNTSSMWANAKNSDGSYFVWVPRYAYRITYYASSTSDQVTGYCDGDGIREVNGNVKYSLSGVQTVESNGIKYIIHPAFTNGTSNNFKNGEWNSELSGIWVAKYETSKSDAKADAAGSSSTLKIQPGVQSWRSITIENCYNTAYNYDRNQESHLMKNSEWGAVAYLTHSQYGRNGNEIDINNSSSFITGNDGGSTNAGQATGTTNAYNTITGAKASSTGNIYGIYDLSGGAWEYTAGYITNRNSNLSYGSSFVATTEANTEGYKTLSTPYATVYPYYGSSDTSDTNTNNYTAYRNAGYGYGDAILETSTSGSGTTSWNGDYSSFPYTNTPFFLRGGGYSNGYDAGVFYFHSSTGYGSKSCSFRVVLVGV